uniref:Uncharacterized protein n=1 Tax=Favella ehrenbergii TaxID=182087 RepID=A0A7S3I0K7_9SPIT|mmetsp:Transcript_23366/g.28987  ORF Transcript_23366/g.28987 Transcript_23366/m.28987 type:complete len:133 (+) Transcript_23366:332-730(+)
MSLGTEWSVAFTLNGITLILLSLTYLGFALGSHIFMARIVAACANFWLICVHLSAIIVTLVHRFSLKGKLASICQDGSVFEGWGQEMSSSWTFEKDSQMMTVILFIQMFVIFILCCHGSLPLRQMRVKAVKK